MYHNLHCRYYHIRGHVKHTAMKTRIASLVSLLYVTALIEELCSLCIKGEICPCVGSVIKLRTYPTVSRLVCGCMLHYHALEFFK